MCSPSPPCYNAFKSKNGLLTLPQEGNQYAFLVLPDRDTMLPKVARRLKRLVAAGAVIVGPRLCIPPSMAEFPFRIKKSNTIRRELWGAIDDRKSLHKCFMAKGRLFWGKTPERSAREFSILHPT